MNKCDKKKRAPNYTLKEKTLLLNIIYSFKNIIENKKTSSQTWRDKDEAWDKITKMFNSQSDCPRNKDSLKKYYENIKKLVRKEVAEEKMEITKTGGGQNIYKNDTNSTKDLTLSIINEKSVFGLNNPYGGDVEMSEDASVQEQNWNFEINNIDGNNNSHKSHILSNVKDHDYAIVLEEENDLGSDECAINEANTIILPSTPKAKSTKDWSKISATQLKEVVSESLKPQWTKRRRPAIHQSASKLSDEYSELASVKLELYQLEKKEIDMRIKRSQEIFELEKQKLLLEIEYQKLKIKLLNKSE